MANVPPTDHSAQGTSGVKAEREAADVGDLVRPVLARRVWMVVVAPTRVRLSGARRAFAPMSVYRRTDARHTYLR